MFDIGLCTYEVVIHISCFHSFRFDSQMLQVERGVWTSYGSHLRTATMFLVLLRVHYIHVSNSLFPLQHILESSFVCSWIKCIWFFCVAYIALQFTSSPSRASRLPAGSYEWWAQSDESWGPYSLHLFSFSHTSAVCFYFNFMIIFTFTF